MNLMEFWNKIKFRNPCKYCLKRPVCKKKCKDLSKYINTCEVTLISSTLCLVIIFSVSSIILCWNINIYLNYIIISLLTIIYAVSNTYFFKNEKASFDKDGLWLLICIILMPWGYITTFILDKTNLYDLEEEYSKRHSKHLF